MHETIAYPDFGKTPQDRLIYRITLTGILTADQEAELVVMLLDKSTSDSHRNLILTALNSLKQIHPELSPAVDRILNRTNLRARIKGVLARSAQVGPLASH